MNGLPFHICGIQLQIPYIIEQGGVHDFVDVRYRLDNGLGFRASRFSVRHVIHVSEWEKHCSIRFCGHGGVVSRADRFDPRLLAYLLHHIGTHKLFGDRRRRKTDGCKASWKFM